MPHHEVLTTEPMLSVFDDLPRVGEFWQIDTERYGSPICQIGLLPRFEHFGLQYLFVKTSGKLDGFEVGGVGATNPRRAFLNAATLTQDPNTLAAPAIVNAVAKCGRLQAEEGLQEIVEQAAGQWKEAGRKEPLASAISRHILQRFPTLGTSSVGTGTQIGRTA